MSRFAMTLRREVTGRERCLGGGAISYRAPSTRYRILNSVSNGSADVARAVLDRLGQHEADELHDRDVVGEIDQVGAGAAGSRLPFDLGIGAEFLEELGHRIGTARSPVLP